MKLQKKDESLEINQIQVSNPVLVVNNPFDIFKSTSNEIKAPTERCVNILEMSQLSDLQTPPCLQELIESTDWIKHKEDEIYETKKELYEKRKKIEMLKLYLQIIKVDYINQMKFGSKINSC